MSYYSYNNCKSLRIISNKNEIILVVYKIVCPNNANLGFNLIFVIPNR